MILDKRYYWGARPGHRDELVFRDRPDEADERLYCLMDYFSPAAIVDLSGAVQERYTFSAFGKRRVLEADYTPLENSAFDWDFGFQGQFVDLETWNGSGEQTGLYNYGYRYYVPALGRWPNRDPIGEKGGVNFYEYINNCAINSVDRLGLQPMQDNHRTIDFKIQLYSSTGHKIEFEKLNFKNLDNPKQLAEAYVKLFELLMLSTKDTITAWVDYDYDCCVCTIKNGNVTFMWVRQKTIQEPIANAGDPVSSETWDGRPAAERWDVGDRSAMTTFGPAAKQARLNATRLAKAKCNLISKNDPE